jgi:hypothetical protein
LFLLFLVHKFNTQAVAQAELTMVAQRVLAAAAAVVLQFLGLVLEPNKQDWQTREVAVAVFLNLVQAAQAALES